MAEISSVSSAGMAAPSVTRPAPLVPSLSEVAADQLQQAAQAFEATLTERNRTAAAEEAASCVYSRQGTVGSTSQPGGQLRASA